MNDSVTYDDIMEAVDAISNTPSVGVTPFGPFDPFAINKFYGIPIVEHPTNIKQKIKIRDDFKYCTPEGRAKINNKLLEMFGTVDNTLLAPGQVFRTQYGLIIRSDEACILRSNTLT